MKRSMNQSRELYNIFLAIYGNKCHLLTIHTTINDIHFDRWGTYIDAIELDGTRVTGRLSRNHLFNGKVGNVALRSYRA